MTNTEKVKHVRGVTFSPMNKVNEALKRTDGDVDAAIQILVAEKQADANEMANRTTNTSIVYSYVHNNRIGAMIVLACQTDFVAKSEAFLNLAKNICMHIVSTPQSPLYISKDNIDPRDWQGVIDKYRSEYVGKPPQVISKIVEGKMKKYYAEVCLLNQPFIREDTVTIEELIKDVSSTLGEKIEIKRFTKMVAQ